MRGFTVKEFIITFAIILIAIVSLSLMLGGGTVCQQSAPAECMQNTIHYDPRDYECECTATNQTQIGPVLTQIEWQSSGCSGGY